MFSLRSFARSAPRTVSRLSTSAIRQSTAARTSLLQAAWKPAGIQCVASFSSSALRRAKSGESDDELVLKLDSELQMEMEMKDLEGTPASVKDYLSNGPFEIIDTPGQEEVILTRQYGDEKIHIAFSIADINILNNENDYADTAMENEEDGHNKGEEDNELSDHEAGGNSYPSRLNIVIEKPGKGAINVESIVQDGLHIIEKVNYYADASFAYAKTPEKIQGRQDLYAGPPFTNLDEELQILMEKYLDERGINTALALFVPDYSDVKEQKEYLRWLSNIKGFVET